MPGTNDRNDLSGEGAVRPGIAMVVLLLRRAPIAAVARSTGRYPPCNKMYHIEDLPTRTSRNCALPSSLQREGLEQLRGYESEYERRCMIEYEVAMYVNWLLVTRPPFPPPSCCDLA